MRADRKEKLMRKRYLGITDVPDKHRLNDMIDVFEWSGAPELGMLLHAGIMMSYKTLNHLPSKWTGAWPKNEEIADIFVSDPNVLNTLHYADYDGIDIEASLDRAIAFGGPHLDALQLDMVWPDPKAIARVKGRENASLRIILQVSAVALDQAGNDPDEVVARLTAYEEAAAQVGGWGVRIINDVLFDKSMGRGQGLDADVLRPFIAAVRAQAPDLGISVAGGLGPDSLLLAGPLVWDFPMLSIDAQSKLRPSGDAHDPIDWDMAEAYVRRAVRMFRDAPPF